LILEFRLQILDLTKDNLDQSLKYSIF